MAKLLSIALCNQEPDISGQSMTYNEGGGVKDTVVMTGPLASIYTKALNLYFAKTEISDKSADSDSESVAVATESMMIDTVIQNALVNHLEKDNELLDQINLVPETIDIQDSPTAIVMATEPGNVMSPEVVELAERSSELYEDSGKEWILFVGPDASGEMTQQAITPEQQEEDPTNAFDAGETFKRATESFYSSKGIKVVIGFENLSQWLKSLPKSK